MKFTSQVSHAASSVVRRVLPWILCVWALGLTASTSVAGELGGDFALRLERTRWVAYAPTNYYPAERPPVFPTDESVRRDLQVLREYGFDGLVTYSAEVESVPRIAREVGFRAMLLGVWDPTDATERQKALRSIRQEGRLIIGLIVGNEGVLTARYRVADLCATMAALKTATAKPVSTTEPADLILGMPKLVECSDFITVNAHPFFAGQKDPQEAVAWTIATWDDLRKEYPSKALVFKEVGLPSAGEPALSDDNQRRYYELLGRTSVRFVYFEAFDASPRFKEGAVEQSWGLFTNGRKPKAVVKALPWLKVNSK